MGLKKLDIYGGVRLIEEFAMSLSNLVGSKGLDFLIWWYVNKVSETFGSLMKLHNYICKVVRVWTNILLD